MTNKNSDASRRKLIKSIAAGSGAVIAGKSLPETWGKPIVDSVMLPAHAQTSREPVYEFVGSWFVYDGAPFGTNPPVYTGQEAAALLFGGSPSDYRISTVDNQPANINDSAWVDGYADGVTYGTSGTPAPHDFSADVGAPGYTESGDYSAYVRDHSAFSTLENFAFRLV